MDHFPILFLPDELIERILIRLDFYELAGMRTMCRRVRQIVGCNRFVTNYHNEGGAMLWDFTYYRRNVNPPEHWVLGIREQDGVEVNFRFSEFHENLGNHRAELIDVWRSVLVFYVPAWGFLLLNLWTSTSMRIRCPFSADMTDINTIMGTRIDEHPLYMLEFMLINVRRVYWMPGTQLRFFSSSIDDHYPPDDFSEHLPDLNPNNMASKMVITMHELPTTAIVSVQDGRPAHILRATSDLFGDGFWREFRPNTEGPLYANTVYCCNKGCIAAVELRFGVVRNTVTILSVRLFGLRENLEGGYQLISKMPERYIPDIQAVYVDHRLMVTDDLVYLTMKIRSPEGEPYNPYLRRYLMFRFDLITRKWDSVEGYQTVVADACSTTFCGRIKVMPNIFLED
ncbi:hypothetical protein QVD17_26426 [Tagetes erecta]|uniref:F-box domain-containing protein n=1 Tax=Tagetes erecta TaxID=13708 RepID=A0AAD8NIK3_TARER|nr:hypothetical protein QVD17_26426 [Tagetes erecta]